MKDLFVIELRHPASEAVEVTEYSEVGSGFFDFTIGHEKNSLPACPSFGIRVRL